MADLPPFEDVYTEYANRIFRFCLWLLHDSEAAEDVTADTFMAAYVAYERVRPGPDALQPWLFRIAKNRALNHRRGLRRLGRVLGALQRRPMASTDVEDTVEVRQELDQVIADVATLAQRDRLLIGLRCGAELSYAEIGQLLGLQEVAARTATYRALERLRERGARR